MLHPCVQLYFNPFTKLFRFNKDHRPPRPPSQRAKSITAKYQPHFQIQSQWKYNYYIRIDACARYGVLSTHMTMGKSGWIDESSVLILI